MALTALLNTGILADATKITAKTPVTPNATNTKWSFQVLIDGHWIRAEYPDQAAADSAYATVT